MVLLAIIIISLPCYSIFSTIRPTCKLYIRIVESNKWRLHSNAELRMGMGMNKGDNFDFLPRFTLFAFYSNSHFFTIQLIF